MNQTANSKSDIKNEANTESERNTNKTVYDHIGELMVYGIEHKLMTNRDWNYVFNRLLQQFHLTTCEQNIQTDSWKKDQLNKPARAVHLILEDLINDAVEMNILDGTSIALKDLFDTSLMGEIIPRPSEVEARFYSLYEINEEFATTWYYTFSIATNYIRKDRIKKDLRWIYKGKYGDLDITINRSKPEKDPKAIAAALKNKKANYPNCLLCAENEGYEGHLTHPARKNHRMIKLKTEDEWYFQYSPYVYYNEHSIFLHGDHHPMIIDQSCFEHLLQLVDALPHYFVGSNADLPIVGGSILSHEHYQGGRYEFAMTRAKEEKNIKVDQRQTDIQINWVCWPLSVMRLKSKDRKTLVLFATDILAHWRQYNDKQANILSHTEDTRHNTITPIARKRDGYFELDLVLRNNLTTKEAPFGLYHPHEKLHHIKKENIGLIEVMGLAVLPARLATELEDLAHALLIDQTLSHCTKEDAIYIHKDWAVQLAKKYKTFDENTILDILKLEVGAVFEEVLECAGVFKRTEQGIENRNRYEKDLVEWLNNYGD